MASIKKQILQLIEQLPENTTGDEILNAIFVRRKIVEAMEAVNEGKVGTCCPKMRSAKLGPQQGARRDG